MASVIRMPEVATGAAEAAIQSWLIDVGATVSQGQPLVEIETEKAVVEYEAEESGVLAGVLLAAGESAAVGVPIAVLAGDGESVEQAMAAAAAQGASVGAAAPAAAPEEPAAVPAAAPASPEPAASATADPSSHEVSPAAAATVPAPSTDAQRRIFASPLVRRLARERGIDLVDVVGSGPNGRIVRRDLDSLDPSATSSATVAGSSPAAGAHPASSTADFQDIPHTGMRRAIARRLSESKSTIPHFYLTADCRVDALLELRAQINQTGGVKISVNDFVLKAVAWAMKDVPEANAIWTDDATRRFLSVDIAVAVSVPSGLLTPVVRGVEKLSLSELGATVKDLASRAREGRIKQQELEGGSFSVSNLGMFGTQEFSAIINPPQAGILAVGAATPRPVVTAKGKLAVGQVMTVTLSADHRVMDGELAARWLAAFVARIENPVSILV